MTVSCLTKDELR